MRKPTFSEVASALEDGVDKELYYFLECLILDERLPFLSTKEFRGAKYKIALMQTKLKDFEKLTEDNVAFLERVKTHIKKIYPHIEEWEVNNKSENVFVVTHLKPVSGVVSEVCGSTDAA